MAHDDYYYWLYKLINKEKAKISINDVTNMLAGLTQILKSDNNRLTIKQNIVRHLNIANELINRLMKRLYYKPEYHFGLFKELINFLFMFVYQNPNNQRAMLPHLLYLVSLTDKDIPTPKLIAQIIWNHKDSDYGIRFLEFLVTKIITRS